MCNLETHWLHLYALTFKFFACFMHVFQLKYFSEVLFIYVKGVT